MGSKIIKRLLIWALCLAPAVGFGQVGFRGMDTALVVTYGGQVMVYKSKAYYATLFNALPKTLQAISDNGNFTTNALQITGSAGLDVNKQGLLLAKTGIQYLYSSTVFGGMTFSGYPSSPIITISPSPSAGSVQFGTTEVAFSTPVSGSNGVSSNHFTTLSQLNTKQDLLVSGANIKTVGGTSLLGSGNIPVPTLTDYIANQNASAQSSSNFWISGTGTMVNGRINGGRLRVYSGSNGFTSGGELYAYDNSGTDAVVFTSPSRMDVQSTASMNFQASAFNFVTGGGTTFSGNPSLPTTTYNNADSSSNVAYTAWVKRGLVLKQNALVSGTNIKTVGGTSVLGAGNIPLPTISDYIANQNASAQTANGWITGRIKAEGSSEFGVASATIAPIIVFGGASGTPMITLSRTVGSTNKFSWALVGGGLSFSDDINTAVVTNLFGDNSTNQIYIGQRASGSPNTRQSLLSGTTLATGAGSDLSTGNFTIQGSLGTGAGVPGDLLFNTGNVGTSGSAIHTSTTRITVKNNTGNIGLGTTSPTHTLTLPSTSTGITHYNTTDQTTNYERVREYWNSNVWTILSEKGGTGTARGVLINAPLLTVSTKLNIGTQPATQEFSGDILIRNTTTGDVNRMGLAGTPASGDLITYNGTNLAYVGRAAIMPTFANYLASGNGSSTTISVPHGLGSITSASVCTVQARNAASAGISYVTTDATNVNIVYTVPPANGTNNLLYSIQLK